MYNKYKIMSSSQKEVLLLLSRSSLSSPRVTEVTEVGVIGKGGGAGGKGRKRGRVEREGEGAEVV